MLLLRQGAAFVMIMEHEERHRDKQSTIQWYEFQFQVQRKRTAVFMLLLRPTSISVVLVGDVRVYLVRMLFINRACTQDKRAGHPPKLPQVEDGL